MRRRSLKLGRVQRILGATIWPALGGGCHINRDTAAMIEHAGLIAERLGRFRYPESGIPSPASPFILGVVTRP